jgi:hypothetical protein
MSTAKFLYTDAEPIKVELELGSGATFTDELDGHLTESIEEASRMIDDYKRVEAGSYKTSDYAADEVRYYFGSGRSTQDFDFATSITELAVEETDGTYTAWTEDTDYYLWPPNALQIGEAYRAATVSNRAGTTKSVFDYGYNRVRVTGKFGISVEVPAQIERACKVQVQRWYHRALQGWQDTGGNQDLGLVRYTKELDPEVKGILKAAFPHVARIAV